MFCVKTEVSSDLFTFSLSFYDKLWSSAKQQQSCSVLCTSQSSYRRREQFFIVCRHKLLQGRGGGGKRRESRKEEVQENQKRRTNRKATIIKKEKELRKRRNKEQKRGNTADVKKKSIKIRNKSTKANMFPSFLSFLLTLGLFLYLIIASDSRLLEIHVTNGVYRPFFNASLGLEHIEENLHQCSATGECG